MERPPILPFRPIRVFVRYSWTACHSPFFHPLVGNYQVDALSRVLAEQ